MQLLMSGILNIMQLVGVTTSLWTMDTLGRRWILLSGAMVMTLCHVIIAILVGLFSNNWPAHTAEGWTSVAFLLVYMLAFGASWGPLGWSLPSGKLDVSVSEMITDGLQKSFHLRCVPRVWLFQRPPTGSTTLSL